MHTVCRDWIRLHRIPGGTREADSGDVDNRGTENVPLLQRRILGMGVIESGPIGQGSSSDCYSGSCKRLDFGRFVGKITPKHRIFLRERIIEPGEHIILMDRLIAVGGGLPQYSPDEHI